MKKRPDGSTCELCGREKPLSFHHLIPRGVHRKRWIRDRFGEAERHARGIWVCRLCHRQIHRFFDKRELAEKLNTKKALQSDPRMARFIRWARKKK